MNKIRTRIQFPRDDRLESIGEFLSSLLPILTAHPHDVVSIDVREADYVGPASAVALAASCRWLTERGGFWHAGWPGGVPQVKKFWNAYRISSIPGDIGCQADEDGSETLAIQQFFNERFDQALPLMRIISRHLELSPEDEVNLAIALGEVFRNVEEHADSAIGGFWAAQYSPSERTVHAAVVDLGQGIPTTVRRAHPEVASNKDALRRALEPGVTAQSIETNQGQGLNNLAGIVRDMRGELLIVSEDVALEITETSLEPIVAPLSVRFPGTLVSFTLRLGSFPS